MPRISAEIGGSKADSLRHAVPIHAISDQRAYQGDCAILGSLLILGNSRLVAH